MPRLEGLVALLVLAAARKFYLLPKHIRMSNKVPLKRTRVTCSVFPVNRCLETHKAPRKV